MSWFSGIPENGGVTIKVTEVRFTQGAARLNSVGIAISSQSQQFVSKTTQPHPADPISHRSKVQWPDTELKLLGNGAVDDLIKINITNRRRHFRTVIGSTVFTLAALDLPTSGKTPVERTLLLETALSSSLNLKIDFVIELVQIDSWHKLRPHLHPPGVLEGAVVDAPEAEHIVPSNISSSVSGTTSDSSSVLSYSTLQSLEPTQSSDIKSSNVSLGSTEHKETKDIGFNLNSRVDGVVFLEIVSVANLPKFRTLTGISFDMDPFVVLSFGRKVYKTPYRRHTLNPTFNCKIAFEVHPSERQFSIVLSVWDMDRITLNDQVAEIRLPVMKIMQMYAPKINPLTQLYDLDNHVPSVLVLPLEHVAGTAEMVLKAHYYPETAIRQQMWRGVIGLYMAPPPPTSLEEDARSIKGTLLKLKPKLPGSGNNSSVEVKTAIPAEGLDLAQLKALLNSLGSTLSSATIEFNFFRKHELDPETDIVDEDTIVMELEEIVKKAPTRERVILFRICPICHKSRDKLLSNNSSRLALHHLALCASRQWAESNSVLLDSTYVSSAQASKRWYSNFLSKFSYGTYKLGAHSANILVQDRVSGQISEEKIATSVRIGIRMIYALGPVERKKFQNLLKRYTLRQGIKYSSPSSASQIEPFIKYHNLDMSEVELPVSKFPTFNEFFYRKLKPGSRPCENPMEPKTAVSSADCRLTVFNSVSSATELWIKGKNFSVERLLADTYPDDARLYTELGSSIAIFRLAPQDYHRVHSPVDGIMGQPKHIDGHYYTVNPMAVRSGLDVFGENARTVFPIQSPVFGKVMVVMVGAMMVGSCVVSAKPGCMIRRTDELGYFQFGGSTVVLLFERNKLVPDSDLLANSKLRIETLVKVGMSFGHAPGIPEFVRSYDTRHTTIRRAKSAISGGGAYLPFALD